MTLQRTCRSWPRHYWWRVHAESRDPHPVGVGEGRPAPVSSQHSPPTRSSPAGPHETPGGRSIAVGVALFGSTRDAGDGEQGECGHDDPDSEVVQAIPSAHLLAPVFGGTGSGPLRNPGIDGHQQDDRHPHTQHQ